jgi:hypothetical protein
MNATKAALDRRCVFSPDRKHRYTLWRELSMFEPKFVQFIGLNPSTADEVQDDPTIRRCIDFANQWGYGALCMTNLFGFRATDPADMKAAPDPVGADNVAWLLSVAQQASMVLCAWGTDGIFKGQGKLVTLELIRAGFEPKLRCLGFTKGGNPKHPLYLAASEQPRRFNWN